MARGGGESYNPVRRSSKKNGWRISLWFQRNEHKLLATCAISVLLLFFLHFFPPVFQLFLQENPIVIQIVTLILVCTIALPVMCKGIVPIVICIFGIILLHNSMILPQYAVPQPGEASFGDVKIRWTLFAPTAVSVAADMHFYLGVSMIILSVVIAYRPSLLFTRNRPDPIDSHWLKYPLWHDHTVLADGSTEYSVPIKTLVTEEERYILWRYEFILANIYGDPHLVKPGGYVPKYSTSIYRDKESGRIIGKARYSGLIP
jgi:uncharacterized membrane protein